MGKPKKFVVGGLLNLGYGLATAGASYAQRQKALRQLGQLGQMEDGNIMSLAARRRVARQESDAQSAIDEAARATASSLAAAQEAGGFRGVQSISPSLARAQQEAVNSSLMKFGEYGARASQQENSDLIMSRQAALANQRSGFQAAADQATQNMVQGLGMAAGGFAQTLGGIGKKPKATPGAATAPDAVGAAAPGVSKMQGLGASQMSAITQQLANTPGVGKPFERPRIGTLPGVTNLSPEEQLAEEERQLNSILAEGPKRELKNGGKAMKTPGAFSHNSNPIDVIKDGKKIAEMTGGEYIFNPKQSEKMRSLSEKGNTTLHKFVRDLLSKRQFK
jgi:hypothetical protein